MGVEILVGKTLSSHTTKEKGDNELKFKDTEGNEYVMHHHQDCCESVYIEDIAGELDDLVGTPIVSASEESNGGNSDLKYDDSVTWTFYRISTIKGTVVIRWYGSSNGYYSEDVDFHKVGDPDTYCG